MVELNLIYRISKIKKCLKDVPHRHAGAQHFERLQVQGTSDPGPYCLQLLVVVSDTGR